jgi:hypothetical protein
MFRRRGYRGRAVQTHLAHIFAKLDISSRAQLAAEVTRRQRDEANQRDVALSANWRMVFAGRELGDEYMLAAGAVGGLP